MKKRKKKFLRIISTEEVVELSEAYADCFSNDRDSPEWLEAYEEYYSSCGKYNNFILKGGRP